MELADTVIPAVGAIGRIGYWCWETMTPLVVGSYRTARGVVDVALILWVGAATRNIFDDFQNDLGANPCRAKLSDTALNSGGARSALPCLRR